MVGQDTGSTGIMVMSAPFILSATKVPEISITLTLPSLHVTLYSVGSISFPQKNCLERSWFKKAFSKVNEILDPINFSYMWEFSLINDL